MLQNHPGEMPFPVRPWRMRDLPEQRAAFIQGVGAFGAIALLLAVFIFGLASEAQKPVAVMWIGGAAVVAVGIALIACSVMLYRKAVRAPLREQTDYYQRAGIGPLTTDQRQAIALDAVNIGYGSWSETLEDWPCEARLGAPLPAFKTFSLLPVQQSREELDSFWGVVTTEQYVNMVQALRAGMHSRGFAIEAAGPDALPMFRRLADLLGWSTERVADAANRPADGPPTLVWGFDLWRAIRLSRDAFMAGLISEDHAWRDLLETSALIRTVFPTLDTYIDSLRLGHAYWSNDLKTVNERASVLQAYLDDEPGRPVRSLPWVRANALLSADTIDGFAGDVAGVVPTSGGPLH